MGRQPSRGLDSAAHTHKHTRVTVTVTPAFTPGEVSPYSSDLVQAHMLLTRTFNTPFQFTDCVGLVERFHPDTACGLWAGGWGCCLAAGRPPPQPPLPLYQWSARSSPLPPEIPLGGHVLLAQPSPGTCGWWRGRGAGPLGCAVYSTRLLGPMWVMGTAVPRPGRPTPGPPSS